MIKRVDASEFDTIKKTTASTKLVPGDALVYVGAFSQPDTVLVSSGKAVLRFPTDQIPLLKKGSVGVRGMKLASDDRIETVYGLDPNVKSFVKIGSKKVNLTELKRKRRDGRPDTL